MCRLSHFRFLASDVLSGHIFWVDTDQTLAQPQRPSPLYSQCVHSNSRIIEHNKLVLSLGLSEPHLEWPSAFRITMLEKWLEFGQMNNVANKIMWVMNLDPCQDDAHTWGRNNNKLDTLTRSYFYSSIIIWMSEKATESTCVRILLFDNCFIFSHWSPK